MSETELTIISMLKLIVSSKDGEVSRAGMA